MSTDSQAKLSAYLGGSAQASSSASAFGALTTAAERVAYLENLTVSVPLLGTETSATVKAQAQVILMASLSSEDVANVFIEDLFPASGSGTPDLISGMKDVFTLVGPEKAAESFKDINLGLSTSGRPAIDLSDLQANPMGLATSEYLTNTRRRIQQPSLPTSSLSRPPIFWEPSTPMMPPMLCRRWLKTDRRSGRRHH